MNNEFFLMAILVVLTILVIAIFAILIYLLLRTNLFNKEEKQDKSHFQGKSVEEAFTCINHHDQNAVATCAICEGSICEHCHKDWDGIHLCPDHFGLYSLHSWQEIAEIQTNPKAPEKGHQLYAFKNKLWSDEKVPTYLVTHYKINVDGDFVESWVKLYAREEEADQLSMRFKVDIH
tara:strand:- start:118 stop:648 length:531 start_codon:yes stop_codon:yes gene_type:complete